MSSTTSLNNKFKVFVTQPIPAEAVSILLNDKAIDLHVNQTTPLSRCELLECVRDCDALFCTLNEKVDKELLDAGKERLKVSFNFNFKTS